jgi:hypothetical protein
MQDYLSIYKIRFGVGTGSGKANMKQKNGINITFEVLDASSSRLKFFTEA